MIWGRLGFDWSGFGIWLHVGLSTSVTRLTLLKRKQH